MTTKRLEIKAEKTNSDSIIISAYLIKDQERRTLLNSSVSPFVNVPDKGIEYYVYSRDLRKNPQIPYSTHKNIVDFNSAAYLAHSEVKRVAELISEEQGEIPIRDITKRYSFHRI